MTLALTVLIGGNFLGVHYRRETFNRFRERMLYFDVPTTEPVYITPKDGPVFYQIWETILKGTQPYRRPDYVSGRVMLSLHDVDTGEVIEIRSGPGHCYHTLDGRQGAVFAEWPQKDSGRYQIRAQALRDGKIDSDAEVEPIKAALGPHFWGGGGLERVVTYALQIASFILAAGLALIARSILPKTKPGRLHSI